MAVTASQKRSQFPFNTVKAGSVWDREPENRTTTAYFPPKTSAPSTERIDWDTKLKYQFVLDWIVSSVFAPLPLRTNTLLNYASIRSGDAAVN